MGVRAALLCGSMVALVPGAAQAGDKVLEGEAPSWVSVADLASVDAKKGPPELLADFQHRIEDGVVYSYLDHAVRIDNSQTLMEQNTLDLAWAPDKGDLTVHRLQILREGEVIDLLAEGAEFDVIRREQGLEARLLDGELTATLSIPGLRVGDVLRTAYSVSIDDQALGEEAQVLQYLGAQPWRVGMGRAVVSWPSDEEVFWKVEDSAVPKVTERDGYRYLSVDLPLAEAEAMPSDAPSRYHRPTVLRVGSFADWSELSRVMAPHYLAAAEVADDSEVAKQAAAIVRQSSDPLERAALATRLVQDEISYLMNGLDGGNYLPQAAGFTWDKRYGDCKAKSALLLALLKRMGIEAEAALVTTGGGDALPYLQPVPGDFDHVIVRARIGGEDYWLDGTSAATRLANIADVPPFHYALPLREGGADLTPMKQREKAVPDFRMTGAIDHSAGIDFPQLVSLRMDVAGPAGAPIEAMADAGDPELLRRMAGAFATREGLDGGVLTSVEVHYDKEAAIGSIEIEAIVPSAFSWENGKVVVEVEAGGAEGFMFNPDRARADWRDIPVATPGPSYARFEATMKLPQGGRGFSIAGSPRQEITFANTRAVTVLALEGDTVRTQFDSWQGLGEVAPNDIAETKRRVLSYQADAATVTAPSHVIWRWDLEEAEREAKVTPFVAAFDRAIAFALENETGPLIQKALFLESMYEYAEALAVYDVLIAQQSSAWAHLQRAGVLFALKRDEEALTAIEAAYELDSSNDTAFVLAKQMAYAGRASEAIELLDALPVSEEEQTTYADTRATVTALQGQPEEALALLSHEVADKPQDADILNSDCWFRGLFNVAVDSALSSCTRAVERAQNPAAALDSRAMVRFRLGDYDAAIADLDAALALVPDLAPSRYLRGVVRIAKGDQGGREDIETALRMAPQLAAFYGRHGVAAGS